MIFELVKIVAAEMKERTQYRLAR